MEAIIQVYVPGICLWKMMGDNDSLIHTFRNLQTAQKFVAKLSEDLGRTKKGKWEKNRYHFTTKGLMCNILLHNIKPKTNS